MDTTRIQPEHQPSFLHRHGAKLVALFLWLAIVGSYYFYARQNNLTIEDSLTNLAELMTSSLYGPLLYVLLYALRPLLFFPSTILTVMGGFLFGPIGIIYTIIGSNASAMVAYTVGRYFGKGVLSGDEEGGTIQKYVERMRKDSFETILIMRLIFLPYDVVSYLAGFLRINWKSFLAGTIIGTIPGTISVVLFGASFGTLDDLLAGSIELNPITMIVSVLLVGISIGISQFIKRREGSE